MEVLKIKHLTVPAPVISTSPIDFDAFVVNKDMVLGRIRSFPEDTACGRDGCHAQHFLDALSGPAVVVSDDVHAFIIAIVNLLLAGGLNFVMPLLLGSIMTHLLCHRLKESNKVIH
ncbi:uncharacterized protein LOC113339911 isoform X4 [Papaver somniferum]|uniref:uncharacterized protein LOC113339911 isoform X4 n=1 Tax=Papaver somniferum TaxID=3469 RepID=UPI000E6FF71A|nr:uncharacterized protein LOC113339911 isoform X4 [Papaver somniferum]